MSFVLALALVAPPAFNALPPEPLLQPELLQRLVDPPRCLQASCLSGEWVEGARPGIPAGQLRVDGSALPGGGGRLRLPGVRPDWIKAQGSNARVGLQYGTRMVETGQTRVSLLMEPAYRLQGGVDDGIEGTGPVLRGQIAWSHALGAHAQVSQTARLEAGQGRAYLRNSLSVVWQLHPQWSLGTGVDTRHDSAIPSRNQTDMTVKLRYLF